VKVVRLDLAEDDLTGVFEGADVVFHLAAQPGIFSLTKGKIPFDAYLKNNVVATHRVLEALQKSTSLKLMVFTSTSSVYGSNASGDEETAPAPTSYYGVTKLAAEQLVLAYNREKGFPACSVRLFSVYGPRERPDKLYPKLLSNIFKGTDFPWRDGFEEHVRSYTYISDIIDGFEAVLNNLKKCNGEIFNIGTDQTITTGEAVKIVEELTGKKANYTSKQSAYPGDQKRTQANIAKARRVLGYSPKITPQEGLKKTVEWYRSKVLK
ncbi:MAG: NAD-dependent epimerase/dehydratase family protein, partial [Candidatus Diapherotrites archaeon]|nr:NAD-dependent epimerase/dehydratase family protein [Candidatus Diapherotrites archaeon]